MDGTELLTQNISVDWAFSRGPFKRRNMRRRYVPFEIIVRIKYTLVACMKYDCEWVKGFFKDTECTDGCGNTLFP